jgi:tetratricopeptide (TPR) repeat protein
VQIAGTNVAKVVTFLLSCSLLIAQSPEARKHFLNGVGLYGEHDDSGDALREAQQEFSTALRLTPKYAAPRAYQGLIALEENRDAEAAQAFEDALSWDRHCAEALVGQARLNARKGTPRQTLILLRQAVAAAPRNVLARRELTLTLTNENNQSFQPTPAMWQEAIESWRVLIAVDRNDRDAHYDLAGAYRRFNRWSEAEREFREVLRIGQTREDSDVWVYSVHGELAEMLAKQGKNAQAIQQYEALIASDGAGQEEIRRARNAIEMLRRLSARPRP